MSVLIAPSIAPNRPLSEELAATSNAVHADAAPALTFDKSSAKLRPAVESWQAVPPALVGRHVMLREPDLADAAPLCRLLNSSDVGQFLAEVPSSVDAFERFIKWVRNERSHGRFLAFGVRTFSPDAVAGLFELWPVDPARGVAEWGFALGRESWGTGLFVEGAALMIDFAFDRLSVRRLEARASAANRRGNAALRKLGAHRCDGSEDKTGHLLWVLDAAEWRARRQGGPAGRPPVAPGDGGLR